MKRNIFNVFMACFCLLVLSSETFCMKRDRNDDQNGEYGRNLGEPANKRRCTVFCGVPIDAELYSSYFGLYYNHYNQELNKLKSCIDNIIDGKLEEVKSVVKSNKLSFYNAEIDGKGKGDSFFHYAVRFGDAELVKLLIEKGADAYKANRNFVTPLMCSLKGPHSWEVFKLLLSYDRNINARNLSGSTVLHGAIIFYDPIFPGDNDLDRKIIELVCCGANVFEKNNFGKTPLDLLESKVKKDDPFYLKFLDKALLVNISGENSLEVRKILCEKGARVERGDKRNVVDLRDFLGVLQN